MGENTKIEWAKHTFNPWIGCTKVSPGCDHCYAESLTKRAGVEWGKGAARRLTSVQNWQLPLRWNRKAEVAGARHKVFCASLADVFDNEVPDEWRGAVFAKIVLTPNLDWLLLTKRPQVALRYKDHPVWKLPNVWLGTSVENQKMADLRIPTLLQIPAAKRFLSVEPLLGPVDLTNIKPPGSHISEEAHGWSAIWTDNAIGRPWLDWVIVGGESGPKARPMHPAWARSIRDQCVAAGVPFFFKQWGEWAPEGYPGQAVDYSRVWRVWCDGEWRERADICTADDLYDWVARIGKKAAGRLLDGREWNEVPAGVPADVVGGMAGG